MDRVSDPDRVGSRSFSVQPSLGSAAHEVTAASRARSFPQGLLASMALIGGLLVAGLSLSACSARTDSVDYEGGGPGPVLGNDCQGSEKRCAGKSLQACDRGSFRTTRECAADQICEVNLGCIQCNPIAATSCQGDVVYRCNGDGTLGEKVETCKPGACAAGKCGEICTAAGSDLIYVVDSSNRLFSFNPRDAKYEFKQIGTLACPAGRAFDGTGKATPFSMSVDRDARAWVLYSSGEIFHVETKDASCKASGFQPAQSGFELFGMGFVSDAENSDKETLFVGGGDYDDQTRANLGSIDGTTLKLRDIGPLALSGQRSPELTGTGKGEFYGYFPGSRPFVAQIDKATGRNMRSWSLPPLSGEPRAWAFAHWGGRFFIFITTDLDGNNVYMLDPSTGNATKVKTHNYRIVGAGVSTCAPVIIG